MNIIEMLVLYTFGACVIGIPIGQKSLEVWDEGKRFLTQEGIDSSHTGGFWGFTLFPFSAITETVGKKGYRFGIERYRYGPHGNQKFYLAVVALLWLPKIVFNILIFLNCTALGLFLMMTERIFPHFPDRLSTLLKKAGLQR